MLDPERALGGPDPGAGQHCGPGLVVQVPVRSRPPHGGRGLPVENGPGLRAVAHAPRNAPQALRGPALRRDPVPAVGPEGAGALEQREVTTRQKGQDHPESFVADSPVPVDERAGYRIVLDVAPEPHGDFLFPFLEGLERRAVRIRECLDDEGVSPPPRGHLLRAPELPKHCLEVVALRDTPLLEVEPDAPERDDPAKEEVGDLGILRFLPHVEPPVWCWGLRP